MGRAEDEIRAAGGDIVAVFQYRAQPTRNYCNRRDVPFDCLADPQRDAYRAVGLDRGQARDYVSPKVALSFLKAVRTGGAPGKPDPHAQRPGTFVVARGGAVVLAHYNADPADNPSLEAILEAVRAGAS
ncbi:MAG: peroxiredoxin-like family protein [Thermoleophilaceae bacterium]